MLEVIRFSKDVNMRNDLVQRAIRFMSIKTFDKEPLLVVAEAITNGMPINAEELSFIQKYNVNYTINANHVEIAGVIIRFDGLGAVTYVGMPAQNFGVPVFEGVLDALSPYMLSDFFSKVMAVFPLRGTSQRPIGIRAMRRYIAALPKGMALGYVLGMLNCVKDLNARKAIYDTYQNHPHITEQLVTYTIDEGVIVRQKCKYFDVERKKTNRLKSIIVFAPEPIKIIFNWRGSYKLEE